MDRATLNLLSLSVSAALLVWFNDIPEGPRLRGPGAYAGIVGLYFYLVFIGAMTRVDRSFVFGTPGKPSCRPARMDGPRAEAFLRRVLLLGALALLYFAAPDGGSAPVGIKTVYPAIVCFAAGIACYGVLWGAFTGAQRARGRSLVGVRATLRANRFLFPRDPRHSPPIGAAMLLNPFVEEFLLRGVLVHLVGHLGGQWTLAIGAGLIVNVGLHAYQGRALVPWHTAFYAAAVALLLSDVGLWGAIGLHFAGDVVPLLSFRWYFATLRRLRAARTYSARPSLRSGQ